METDGASAFADPDIEAGATAVPLRWEKLRGEEGNGMEGLMHIPDEMKEGVAELWSCYSLLQEETHQSE